YSRLTFPSFMLVGGLTLEHDSKLKVKDWLLRLSRMKAHDELSYVRWVVSLSCVYKRACCCVRTSAFLVLSVPLSGYCIGLTRCGRCPSTLKVHTIASTAGYR